MRIEHVALWTNNLEQARDFYVQWFGGASGEKYVNQQTHFQSFFITFEGGARLEILSKPDLPASPTQADPRSGYAHISFSVGSREAVDALTERMRQHHIRVVGEPRLTGDGYYESCVLDPDNNRIEITI
jgi:lactoylglutathione lyase